MTENKRYQVETEKESEISIKDNISKKYLFNMKTNDSLEFHTLLTEVMNVTVQLNKLWEHILRLGGYNLSILNNFGMIDNIITKTDLDNHTACVSAIKRIDELTNGYGDGND